MDFKLLGSVLLIVGTSIGAGMLALPIATAQLGFIGSFILLIVCWSVMTAGAFLILEVNLWMPQSSNLISMARATLGPLGQLLAWVCYLLLLYSLLCAYISGGSELLNKLAFSHLTTHLHGYPTLAAIIFTMILGLVVFLGIRSVDYVNRILMLIKLSAYILLVFLLAPYISLDKLAMGNIKYVTSMAAVTVTITSFGYAAIIPSLRVYFHGNIKKLRLAIFAGSLIPLVCYIAWDAAIMGIIPLYGDGGLVAILQSKGSTSEFVDTLSKLVPHQGVLYCVKLFTSICVVTSFLGVGLCLVDFMTDALQLENKGFNRIFVHALTFVPPLVIVIFYPHIFVKALEHAGIYCIILLMVIPVWMTWRGRYHHKIANGYQLFGGKILLVALMVFSVTVIILGLLGY